MILWHGVLDLPPDEARDAFRRELVRPEYQERDLLGRVLRWFDRQLVGLVDAAAGVDGLALVAAMVVLVLLVVALAWLLGRLRRSGRRAGQPGPVLGDERASARELRDRAREAYQDGRYDAAVVDGFRALVLEQVERGALPDAPGATAHEVCEQLGRSTPEHGEAVRNAGRLFDEVRYGGRPAGREQAASVLALDDAMAGVR